MWAGVAFLVLFRLLFFVSCLGRVVVSNNSKDSYSSYVHDESEKVTLTAVSPPYQIEDRDRILFIGDSSTVQGSARKNGFVNVFSEQVKKYFPDADIYNAGLNSATNEEIKNKINDGTLLGYFKPTKVIMVAGTDQFVDGKGTDLSKIRFDIEAIMGKLQSMNIPFIFATNLPHGEQYNGENPMEPVLEEYYAIGKAICKAHNAMHVDLYLPMLKYVEAVNVGNTPYGHVTHDGKILNEAGHFLVAEELLKAVGLPLSGVSTPEGGTILEERINEADRIRRNNKRAQDWDANRVPLAVWET